MSDYLIGLGIHDVTGPAAEVGMMGYSMPHQRTAGIHMRLRSRAFIIASTENRKRVIIVCADLGMIFQGVKQQVIKKIESNNELKNLYDKKNVLLSANHTHSGPGGYSHYTLYNLSILGFDKKNFNCIVDGIYESIVKAHNNIVSGDIFINTGELPNAGWNRSPEAYDKNPPEEIEQFDSNTNKTMILLKFVTAEGKEIGMLNWFATHATNLGNKNRLISGDNKGLASYLFERLKGTDYMADQTFVAAFAQAEAGDVSPNIEWGYPDGEQDFNHMEIIANRQFEKAKSLYENAITKLEGNIDYRHKYVDFSNVSISPEWVNDGNNIRTCAAAIGFSKIAGSTEDGIGVEFIPEGATFDSVKLPKITFVPELQKCHIEKRILLPTGAMKPFPWTPEVLPIQIITIGHLAIVAVPFECTTMAGRRLRKTVKNELSDLGIEHFVAAGYSNAYAGYVTSREEYAAQHYEGASTHFGPYTLNAYQQEFHKLAVSLKEGATIEPGSAPRNLYNRQKIMKTGVLVDFKPLFKKFGDVHSDAMPSYQRKQTVRVVFWGGHPRNDLKIQDSYLMVERRSEDGWIPVAYDRDPETCYRWKRSGIAKSKITVEWTIPKDAQPGEYCICHFGHWKPLLKKKVKPYSGTSKIFMVSE